MHPALAARRRRIAALRQRIVAATLATFVLAWGAVVWDGSMGETTTTAQATTTTTRPRRRRRPPRKRRPPTRSPPTTTPRRSRRASRDGRALLLDHEPLRRHRRAARLERRGRARADDEHAAAQGAGPAGPARGAVAGDDGRARRARARAARRRLPEAEPGRRHDPVRQRLRALVDVARDHRRLAVRDPRPLVLLARPDRPAALAQAAPLHGAGVGARRRPLDRDGHRRRARCGSSWRPRRSSSRRARCSRDGCVPAT